MFDHLRCALERPNLADASNILVIPLDAKLKVLIWIKPMWSIHCKLCHNMCSLLCAFPLDSLGFGVYTFPPGRRGESMSFLDPLEGTEIRLGSDQLSAEA